MARTRSSIRRPKIACTPPSPSWPSPWPISPSNMRRSVAFQAAMPPFLGACFGGAGFSLPIRAKLGLSLAPILQGILCAFLCVLSGNPSAPHRRPPSSAVSALVLSLTAPLLCADLRVSAPPRQNHTLGFPIPFHHGPLRGIVLCAFLCVLSGNPSELGDFSSLCSRQSSSLVRAALPGSGISAVSAPGFLFPSASPRLPPCLRGSASKSLPRFPNPFHHGPVLCLELLFPFGPLFARSGRATLP